LTDKMTDKEIKQCQKIEWCNPNVNIPFCCSCSLL